MRLRLPMLRLFALCLWLAPCVASAQDDAASSLGDLARDLRKNRQQQLSPQQQPDAARNVIDNDNLAQAMEDAKKARPAKPDKTVLSIDSASNTVRVSSPDVTCSLSFNARASSLLIKPVLIEDLPLTELLKIDGPGSIQDEALQLEIFNGTDWDIQEITVGLTLERKPGENAELAARVRVIPAAEGLIPVTVERRSDVTLLYHLKADAKPFSTTAFHENIGITPGPDEDWRWSIVEARGIRPKQSPAASEALQEPLYASPSAFSTGVNETTTPAPTANPIALPAVADKPAPGKTNQENSPGPGPVPQR